MIKITDLKKSYGKTEIVKSLNLEVKTGTIFGFLGPNGAGKTTTIKMIVGLSKPTEGTMEIDDKPICEKREIIGFMPEDPYFYDHLSATEFINFMKNLFSTPKNNTEEVLKMVGLEKTAKKKVENFSKGMKQRLGLAQAIINDPDYLFLDEPLDGLDPIGRRKFKEILLELKKRGKTIFFNSHILSDVEEICDQIGIIDKGELIYSGSVKGFRKNKSLEDAFVDRLTK